jgi:hypothetical protein
MLRQGSYGHICSSKQVIYYAELHEKHLAFLCVENNKLTVLNMSLDDLSEHALSVIDLKTKLKISPKKKIDLALTKKPHTYVAEKKSYVPNSRGICVCHTGRSHF